MDPILLILIAIAAFILFRLFSVMGTRSGHEQRHNLDALEPKRPSQDRRADAGQDENDLAEAPPKPVSTNARVLREADPQFDEAEFLKGARMAYEMIVEAFASGDLRSIRAFLSEAVYDEFKRAVIARETANHTADLKFVGVDHAAIVDSACDGEWMTATTEFASNQVRVTRDSDGQIIEGDPNRIDLVKDRWTFSRRQQSADPNWILVATGDAA